MAGRAGETDFRPIYAPFGAAAITPSDTAPASGSQIYRKLWIGGPTVNTLATVKVRMLDGTTPTFSVIPGMCIDIQFDMVFSTGTTATLMVAGY